MSVWLIILLAPCVTSLGVVLAALAGIPPMIAALALVPLVFGAGLVYAATIASVPAGFFAAAVLGAILGAVLTKRQHAEQRGHSSPRPVGTGSRVSWRLSVPDQVGPPHGDLR
jgi:hypothetical protein